MAFTAPNPQAGGQSLSELEIIGIRYRGADYAGPEHAALDRYRDRDTYAASKAPYHYSEPEFPNGFEGEQAASKCGRFGGIIADRVSGARENGRQVLMTGGNCNHATGVLGGLQRAHGSDARIGLVWFDAHGDFNTPRTTITGSLGGMPVAVCAGLALPEWREASGILAPIPTDRIVLSDMRNLDPEEARLIEATDAVVAGMKPGQHGTALAGAVSDLSRRTDMIYLHIDADILDAKYVPHHATIEDNGPDMDQVVAAVESVMRTGKVVALALVSVYFGGQSETDVASGDELLRRSLALWSRYGTTG